MLNGTDPSINVRGASKGISIRGVAGPFAVEAINFAPGTTADDIRAAMEPQGGEIISCKLIKVRPTVEAEIVFVERAGAEAVISIFNNQKVGSHMLIWCEVDGCADFPRLMGKRCMST